MIDYIEFTFYEASGRQNVTGLRVYNSIPRLSLKLSTQMSQVVHSFT